jgi:hypothetical protein
MFKKMSFRNRYVIAASNGLTSLTIPIRGGREQKTVVKQIEIDRTTNWPIKHWRSISSAYRKAPFFPYYEEEVKNLVFNPDDNLFEFNIAIITKLCNTLKINIFEGFTERIEKEKTDYDLRDKFLPRNFQEDGDQWAPRYSQVFEDRIGFQPNLSILDLLFCQGPNAKNLLEKSRVNI